MHTSSHDRSTCKTLVAFALGDSDELLYLRYYCDDPTCDWCIIEYGSDECKEIARISDDLLTHAIYSTNIYTHTGGTGARRSERKTAVDQVDLFSNNEGSRCEDVE